MSQKVTISLDKTVLERSPRGERTLSTLPGWERALAGVRAIGFLRSYLASANGLELCADWIPSKSIKSVSVRFLAVLAIGMTFQLRHGAASSPSSRRPGQRPRLRELPGWDEVLAAAPRRKWVGLRPAGAWRPPEGLGAPTEVLVDCLLEAIREHHFERRDRDGVLVSLQFVRISREFGWGYVERRPETWGLEIHHGPWRLQQAFKRAMADEAALAPEVDVPVPSPASGGAPVVDLAAARERIRRARAPKVLGGLGCL